MAATVPQIRGKAARIALIAAVPLAAPTVLPEGLLLEPEPISFAVAIAAAALHVGAAAWAWRLAARAKSQGR